MKVLDTPLVGLQLVQTTTTHDPRGAFSRLFCARELHVLLGHRQIAQINQSRTTMVGAVRGLHFQHPPHAEMKMVRCLAGRIWDIAVDLRDRKSTRLNSSHRL